MATHLDRVFYSELSHLWIFSFFSSNLFEHIDILYFEFIHILQNLAWRRGISCKLINFLFQVWVALRLILLLLRSGLINILIFLFGGYILFAGVNLNRLFLIEVASLALHCLAVPWISFGGFRLSLRLIIFIFVIKLEFVRWSTSFVLGILCLIRSLVDLFFLGCGLALCRLIGIILLLIIIYQLSLLLNGDRLRNNLRRFLSDWCRVVLYHIRLISNFNLLPFCCWVSSSSSESSKSLRRRYVLSTMID